MKKGITPREQAEIWEKQAKASADRGTDIHKIAEDIMIRAMTTKQVTLPLRPETTEDKIRYVLNDFALQTMRNILATEQLIYSEEHGIAGTVDLLLSDGETIDIYDYKTNKKPIVPHIYYEKMLSPIDDIPANDYYKYALQLSLYRYILELDGFKVNRLCLIHLNENPEIITLPYMKSEVEKIVGDIKHEAFDNNKPTKN